MANIFGQKIVIYLQNVIRCFEFLISHPGFWHIQICESSYVYNKNEHQHYNKMHATEWWWEQQKKHSFQATIILILISSDKTVMNISYGDQTLWPIYIIVKNLYAQTRQSQKWPWIFFFALSPLFMSVWKMQTIMIKISRQRFIT